MHGYNVGRRSNRARTNAALLAAYTGSDVDWVSKWSPGSGYFKVSTCIHGWETVDADRQARFDVYLSNMRQYDETFGESNARRLAVVT